MMYDLLVLAYQTDMTRVCTYMVGREESGATYPQLGVADPHHPLSHHQNDPERLKKLAKINTYHTQLFSDFLAKLRSTPDGEGSLLDHVMLIYGSALRDGNQHSYDNLPILVVGGGCGEIQGGRHVICPKKHTVDQSRVHDAAEDGRLRGSFRRQRRRDPRTVGPRVATEESACSCPTVSGGGVAALLMAASVSAGGRDLRLIQAVKDQDHETVRALLEQKADVNAREGDGATALHWAVLRDDVEAVPGAASRRRRCERRQ